MLEMTALSLMLQKRRVASFTLIELLVVMAIIALLMGLVLFAGSGVMNKVFRNRAATEIQAMSAALENYKTDNGIYPPASGLLTNTIADPYFAKENDGSQSGGAYQTSSQILFLALSGKTNYTDNPVASSKSYMSFKPNQVGNPTGTSPAGGSYVQDPWRNSYGYSTGTASGAATTNYPYNGSGFFDLWSTGGLVGAANTNVTWISNWQ